jgi:hypothetical protein
VFAKVARSPIRYGERQRSLYHPLAIPYTHLQTAIRRRLAANACRLTDSAPIAAFNTGTAFARHCSHGGHSMNRKELSASNPSLNTREDDDQKVEAIRRRAEYARAISEASRASAVARREKAE